MGEKTGIAWTEHTFNPVWGCMKVGPGCDFCYAEQWALRMGFDVWGQGKGFREFGEKHWNEPLRWNRAAAKANKPALVFCASMADVFDNRWPEGIRERLWKMIAETRWLNWQLVTKRIGNVPSMVPPAWLKQWPHNVWLIPTMVNQIEFDRDMPKLAALNPVVRGISYEPALGPLEMGRWAKHVDWLIVGGESKQGKEHEPRVFDMEWARGVIAEAAFSGTTAVFVKQMGARVENLGTRIHLADAQAGANPEEWPVELRVRQFPNPRNPHIAP